jgi:hypothetical protein
MIAATHGLRLSAVLLAVAVGLAVCASGPAAVRNVANLTQLNGVMNSLSNGDEVVIQPGVYNLNSGFYFTAQNVTIRGATGNFDDVVLDGGDFNNASAVQEILNCAGSGVTIKDLTVRDAFYHAIHLQPGVNNAMLDHVHLINNGEQFVKGGTGTPNSLVGGTIQNCLMELTTPRLNGIGGRPDNYIGGIDLLGAVNYNIRDNVFKHIEAADGGDPAIFLWQNIVNPVIERNVTIGCNLGIGLRRGVVGSPVTGAIIRNNFILHDYGDSVQPTVDQTGLELWDTTNSKVYNNTIYSTNAAHSRTVTLYGTNAGLDMRYNIVHGRVRNSTGDLPSVGVGNLIGDVAQPNWFVDPNNADFHLTPLALGAINQALALADAPRDLDNQLRLTPDIGADEFTHNGDANQDGRVNVEDLGILASNYDTTGKYWESADFTNDRTVNVDDLGILASNYDWAAGGLSIPEPATLALLAGGALTLLRRRR